MKEFRNVILIALAVAFITLRIGSNTDINWEISVYLKWIALGTGLLFTYISAEKILLLLNHNLNFKKRAVIYFISSTAFVIFYCIVIMNLRFLSWIYLENFDFGSSYNYWLNFKAMFWGVFLEFYMASILGTVVYVIFLNIMNHIFLRKAQKKISDLKKYQI